MFEDGWIMDFAYYRYMTVEEKIQECMDAARRGEDSISIDRGDLTDAELRYVLREVERRIGRGSF